jgi:predicted GNAT family acetyltransferase
MSDVTDNPERSRFELVEQGQTAFANYRRNGDIVIIPHVESPPALRGKGTADRLMRGIVEKARAENFKIEPWCSYAAAWLRQHRDAHDVLAD